MRQPPIVVIRSEDLWASGKTRSAAKTLKMAPQFKSSRLAIVRHLIRRKNNGPIGHSLLACEANLQLKQSSKHSLRIWRKAAHFGMRGRSITCS